MAQAKRAKIVLRANEPNIIGSLTFKDERFSTFHKIIIFYYNVTVHTIFYGVKISSRTFILLTVSLKG